MSLLFLVLGISQFRTLSWRKDKGTCKYILTVPFGAVTRSEFNEQSYDQMKMLVKAEKLLSFTFSNVIAL